MYNKNGNIGASVPDNKQLSRLLRIKVLFLLAAIGLSGSVAAQTVDRIHTGGLYRDEYLAPLRNGGGNRRHGETLRSAETFENHRFHNGNFMLSTGNAIRPLRLGNAGVGKTEAAVVNGKGVRPAVPASKDFS